MNFKLHAIDPNVKTFYDPGELESKVKAKLITFNKCKYMKSLPQTITDLWTFVLPTCYNEKIQL